MNTLAIVAEYNPFHNGHALHIKKSKAKTGAEHVIVVMSGNFVQRGEPAILDKYKRTHAALLSGADLVLELPLYSATASAEFFASGAVSLLNATGIVDFISFGSELGELAPFIKTAQILSSESDGFKLMLKAELNKGLSYPKARQNALSRYLDGDISFLDNPNNILAVEYIKALIRTGSSIRPVTVLREKAGYHSAEVSSEIASATAVRQCVRLGVLPQAECAVPAFTYSDLSAAMHQNTIPSLDNLSSIFQYIIKYKNADYIKTTLDITEGLENRIIKAADEFYTISDILSAVKTKRYTAAKLRRACLHLLLEITAENFHQYNLNAPPYIRILGFRKEKSHLIKRLKAHAHKPVFMYLKDAPCLLDKHSISILQKEIASTDIYYMSQGSFPTKKGIECTIPPVIV